jgi:putative Flp pilus-assembly TadE/G-like protein
MRVNRRQLHTRLRPGDEQGATLVIVVLSLVAMLGMIVLTVDVGQLLFKRRAMVNASDAAALAAAYSCAGLNDSDSPQALANTYAAQNVNGLSSANLQLFQTQGCDTGEKGYVTVQYAIPQDLFFAGVLGFSGKATVRTQATAGWGPPGGGNPVPIVVYTSAFQGNCDIQQGIPKPGVPCYLWYDNDLFNNSAFGFLNLCPAGESCKHGWDVSPGASCPNVGASEREDWINGNWNYGPLHLHYPATTYVCRVSGLTSSNWKTLENHLGEDLTFPVNDCTKQVDKNGNVVACNTAPDKYDIIGFIKFHLDAVLDSKAEWGGKSATCAPPPMNMTPTSPNIDLDDIAPGLGCTPYDAIGNVQVSAKGNPKCCTLGPGPGSHYTYDALNHIIDWTGNNRPNVEISWEYSEGGPCGVTPNNSSAVCIQVTTVEVQIGGTDPGQGADFGLRAVRLCDRDFTSCPDQT